ncbi:MAG: anaerobic ribonucleoside-triphosphate reductase activating protein [Candidatus Doudnabacteria bacterium]
MQIRGFQKFSLLDYPGKIAAIIFTSGCTLRCAFCYNPELVREDSSLPVFTETEVLKFLGKRKGKLEALVITGGEPTLQADLPRFISRVKDLGYLIKLDTNGSDPVMLKKLIQEKFVDYAAMDLKTSWQDYPKVQPAVELARIKESAAFLLRAKKPDGFHYEFRTTLFPPLVRKDNLEEMVKVIAGAEKYALQQYQPLKTLAPDPERKVYRESVIRNFQKIAEKYVKKVEIRGI